MIGWIYQRETSGDDRRAGFVGSEAVRLLFLAVQFLLHHSDALYNYICTGSVQAGGALVKRLHFSFAQSQLQALVPAHFALGWTAHGRAHFITTFLYCHGKSIHNTMANVNNN